MKKRGTRVSGVKMGKDGKLVIVERKPRNVSDAIRQKKSKKQRCVTKAGASKFNTLRGK